MARRNKPKSPQAIAAEKRLERMAAFEAVNLRGEFVDLAAYACIEVERVGRKASRNRAWRSNVFRLFLDRKMIDAGCYNAAVHVAELWAQWKGMDGRSDRLGEVVDGGSGCAELVTDRMIGAGKTLTRILAPIEQPSRKLVEAFMVATVEEDRPMVWRGIVQRHTGEARRDHQTPVALAALEALRAAYDAPVRQRRAA